MPAHKRPSHHDHDTMKTVVWEGKPFHMATREVPKPKIIDVRDAIVRVTTAAICGSDLHMYHGILGSTNVPWAMGHEAMGIVVETGSSVTSIKKGDRVVISCGTFDATGPGHLQLEPTIGEGFNMFGGGKAFGDLGGLQAEYVRVPLADETLMDIGHPQIPDKEFLFLSDIFATGWEALDYSGFQPGDDVAVFGAGPVGLLCAYSAKLRGASKVYSIDHVPARLAKAKSIGAVPINFTKGGLPSEQILQLAPDGVTRVCDCVGYECVNEKLEPDQGFILNEAVKMASDDGGIGVAGIYFAQPKSKGTPRADIISPNLTFPMTAFWQKSLSMKGGIVDVLKYAPMLFELVKTGVARPGFIVSKEYIGLDQAAEAYRRFDEHLETKILFKFPWHDEEEKARCADGEGTALGREDEAGGELDPHGTDKSIRTKTFDTDNVIAVEGEPSVLGISTDRSSAHVARVPKDVVE